MYFFGTSGLKKCNSLGKRILLSPFYRPLSNGLSSPSVSIAGGFRRARHSVVKVCGIVKQHKLILTLPVTD